MRTPVHSRFVMLVPVEGKDTRSVTRALSKHIQLLPQQLRASLTWDRGTEMADHAKFTVATNVKVYFCDPQSPWQRGSNENTNGLLRQYLPKGTNLSTFIARSYHPRAMRSASRKAQARKRCSGAIPGRALHAAIGLPTLPRSSRDAFL